MVEAGGCGCGLGVAREGRGQSGVTSAGFVPGGWGPPSTRAAGEDARAGVGEVRECRRARAALSCLWGVEMDT